MAIALAFVSGATQKVGEVTVSLNGNTIASPGFKTAMVVAAAIVAFKQTFSFKVVAAPNTVAEL